MVAKAQTSIGEFGDSDAHALADDVLSDFWADRAASWLDALDLNEERHNSLSYGVRLHFVMVIQLRMWELEGLVDLLPAAELPTAAEAAREFVDCARRGVGGFGDSSMAFIDKVLRASRHYFSLAAMRDYAAEVVVAVDHEDELINGLADFIWAHRHDS